MSRAHRQGSTRTNAPAIAVLLAQARTLTLNQIVRLDLVEPRNPDWRVETGIGCGAARAARFAACALVAPETLEPEFLELLLRPSREAVGLSAVVPTR